MHNALSESYMEISIVGDFDRDKVLESLLKTIGALPKRKGHPNEKKKPEALLRKDSVKKVFGFQSTLPQAKSLVYWDLFGIDYEKAEVIAEILEERLRQKVQIELGECYRNSSELCFYGQVLEVAATTDPEKTNYLCDLIIEVAEAIANKGVTQNELNAIILAKQLFIKNEALTNWYWIDCLSRSQEYPGKMKTAKELIKFYKELKIEEINAIAKHYLQSKKAVQIIVVPEFYRSKVEELVL